MGKISPVSAKYIIHAAIEIEGVVDRPDVIGAIFGQTEGLLGSELELRELQRSGRIGRIEVETETKLGKTKGMIIIPSSLDKAETAIVGAALEIIQRIGPCNAKIHVDTIEDVRVSKRKFVIERAKELLRNMLDTIMPDSQELSDEVAYSVRVMEIQEYGKGRLPAGPAIDDSDEILIVEGRADVLNLLKHGIKNAIAINGTSVPEEIADLAKKKITTVFVDGDRGGDLIIQELMSVTEIDFVCKAPDGKEVEEITKKEIHKALRSKIAVEQLKMEFHPESGESRERQEQYQREQRERRPMPSQKPVRAQQQAQQQPLPQQQQQPVQQEQPKKKNTASEKEMIVFSEMLEDLIGTRGAYILDEKLNILGKVPLSELETTLKSLSSGVFAVVFDGNIEKELVAVAEKANIKYLIGMDTKASSPKVTLLTADSF
jgi:DNA primase